MSILSTDTIEEINLVQNISAAQKAVLSTTLYFEQLRLLVVNAKDLDFKQRIMYSWSAIIGFTSFINPLGKDN